MKDRDEDAIASGQVVRHWRRLVSHLPDPPLRDLGQKISIPSWDRPVLRGSVRVEFIFLAPEVTLSKRQAQKRRWR